MSTPLSNAKAELAALQAKVAALSLVPEDDNYEMGTVLRWQPDTPRPGDQYTRVAVKVQQNGWHVAGAGQVRLWEDVVRQYLSGPLAYFEVAPEDWSDARLGTPPPIKTNGMVLADDQGNTWDRHGNEWVLR